MPNAKYNDLKIVDGGFNNYPDFWVENLWLMDREDARALNYPGSNIPNIQRVLFHRYTKEAEVVVDWFLGSGTSIMVGNELNRKIIGVDLNIWYAREHFTATELRHHNLVWGDSSNEQTGNIVSAILKKDYGVPEGAALAFLHPPYHDIINYQNLTGSPNDMSICGSVNHFMDKFSIVMQNAIRTLKRGGWLAILMGDKYQNGQVIPLCAQCLNVGIMMGLTLKGIVTKDIKNNEAKGKDYNLWKYRHLLNGTYFFNTEQLLIFRK